MSFGIEKLWEKHLNVKVIKFFLFPGIIVHELSHALLCLITGTTIKELNIFKPVSGTIKYDRPKIPFLFDFFISASPLFGCAFALVVTSVILGNPIRVDETLPNEFTYSLKAVFEYAKDSLDILQLTLNKFWTQGFHTIGSVIFFLASIIFTVSMAPHRSDIKYIVLGFLVLGLSLFGLEWIGISLLEYKWWQEILDNAWRTISYILSILLTILLITAIIVGLINATKLVFGRKA
ncbi:MAG: M50 family metallopeptidase [Candidatus Scalindua sp.]|nr:M50 family metallopeptidase [Candidatus Scalindua sp.]